MAHNLHDDVSDLPFDSDSCSSTYTMTTQALVDFVKNLPLSINPYEATAEKIKQETRIAKPVLWGLILRRIIAVNFLVLCGQAIVILWLRKKANKLHFFRRNKLGLIHVEMLNELVLLMCIFSLLSFIDLITQELAEQDLISFSSKLVLQICKFPFTAAVAWCKSSSFLLLNFIQTVELCTDDIRDPCQNNAPKCSCGSCVLRRQ
ncbi:hypothetical protein H4Q26_011139 [Puccinia striiformis f. sp. tritici PST-130]|nr:hypothetical protein H4Q26_011139 [Puccinia striiformis f. sp. tritici PST-130]